MSKLKIFKKGLNKYVLIVDFQDEVKSYTKSTKILFV